MKEEISEKEDEYDNDGDDEFDDDNFEKESNEQTDQNP